MSYRYALVCLIASCAPYGTYQWQQRPPAVSPSGYNYTDNRYDDEDGYGAQAQQGQQGQGGNSGEWVCIAEASLGTSRGDGPVNDGVTTGYGSATTRDAAYLQALRNCGALVGASTGISDLYGERSHGGNCEITKCIGPGGRSR
jgi:hypothetical protein